MKTIHIDARKDASEMPAAVVAEVVEVLRGEGLVCLPCGGSYRLATDLTSEAAVSRLLQSKRRTAKAPALVFVGDQAGLVRAVAEVPPLGRRLAEAFWPGPLTLLLPAHPDLPPRVLRALVRGGEAIGVRIPESSLLQRTLRGLDRPLLVSSANPERKKGAGSAAQVRKNFLGRIDLFLDAGDLAPALPSTIVELVGGQPVIRREGAIPAERVRQACAGV